MEAERVIEYFIDENGTEIEDAEKNGKAVVFQDVKYREGESCQITTESGDVYGGLIEKVSTLKTGSNKDIKIVDDSGVGHVIKYELIHSIEKLGVDAIEDDEEFDEFED